MQVVIARGEYPQPALPGKAVATAQPDDDGAPFKAVEFEQIDHIDVVRIQSHGAHVLTPNAWAAEHRNGTLAGAAWDPPYVEPELPAESVEPPEDDS